MSIKREEGNIPRKGCEKMRRRKGGSEGRWEGVEECEAEKE